MKKRIILISLFAILAFLVLVFLTYSFLPVHENANPPVTWGWGVDWKNNISEGALNTISGKNPYTRSSKCFPPWAYLMVSPIALLPPDLGEAVMFVLTYAVYAFVLYRLKTKPLMILIFLLNSFIFRNAKNGNLDFLAVLGFALPPPLGLFFVLMKPQIGAGIALFWLAEAWRNGKFREVFRVFAPVTIAYLLSFLLYGFWPSILIGMPNDAHNSSFWPLGIPIGILFLYKAIRDRKNLFAMGASPFLAPYTNFSSFAVVLIPFTQNILLLLIGVAVSWL